jgi:hypothetical protein
MTKQPIMLPTTLLEAEAVEVICHWIGRVRDKLDSEAGHLLMRASIVEKLKAGAVPRMKVIEAAEAGCEDADLALRELAAELISRHEEMPTELAAFVQRALVQPPVSNPRGRDFVDFWVRDIGIAVLVAMTMERWGLPKSRGRLTRNRLSASYLVACALGRRGIMLGERRVEKIHDGHLKAAERLSAFLPAI